MKVKGLVRVKSVEVLGGYGRLKTVGGREDLIIDVASKPAAEKPGKSTAKSAAL